MANICLIDVDGHNGFPNYALMKIAAWHKKQGDNVSWFSPLFSKPDICYASKIFTFTKDYPYFPQCELRKGGTGYDVKSRLPEEIDSMFPDYSIYPECDYAIGFLTRGCIRHCKWCVVPEKEGRISEYRTIIDLIRRDLRKLILMDNNFLAANDDFVKDQLKEIIRFNLSIDFNQALDARLVTSQSAELLAKVHWIRYIRFSCDTDSQIEPVETAVRLLREKGYCHEIFIYVLAIDFENAYSRVKRLLAIDDKIKPFVMPYRTLTNEKDDEGNSRQVKRLARWCNRDWIRKSCEFEHYKR